MANSPEYRTIIKLTPKLTNAFQSDLISLSDEFLSAGFISNGNAGNLRNQHNDPQVRAANLVGWIRDKIQLEPERNYRAFIDVLKQRLADHESILRCLDEMYKELGGTGGISTPPADPLVLDQVIGYAHIGQIAEKVRQWEGRLSDGLELPPPDVESIKTKYGGQLKLQTREALLMWKERKGDKATYNNLIKIFEGAGNQQCADFIRHSLTFAEA